MPTAERPHAGGGRLALATFEVHGQVYAIEVAHIREVVRWQEPLPLPEAPALIEGVIELRDAVVPVVDLGRALGGPPVRPRPGARIAVLEARGLVFALRVEAAEDVISADAGDLAPPPALATGAGYAALRAVLRRPGERPVLLLSLEHLLERVRASGSLPSAAPPAPREPLPAEESP